MGLKRYRENSGTLFPAEIHNERRITKLRMLYVAYDWFLENL